MRTNVESINHLLNSLRLATDSPSEIHLQHLDWVRQRVKPYDGQWKAPWLLSDWKDPIWQTTSGSKTRQKDDLWIGTSNVNWSIRLPDHHQLTDSHYSILLQTCRQLSFLYRQGYADGNPPSIRSWERFNRQLLCLCQWMVLERSRYLPETYGLSLLDQAGITRLLRSIATGGWTEAHGLVERCLCALYQTVFQEPLPEKLLAKPGNLPKKTCNVIIEWLRANQGYSYSATTRVEDNGLVSRVLIGKLASAPIKSLKKNKRFNAVFRQFEPKISHPTLLIRGKQRTEYPRQDTPTINEALQYKASESSIDSVNKMLRIVLSLYRHQPEYLPSPATLNLPQAVSSSKQLAKPNGHTPFIPVDTGLQYINQALRWVVIYGDAVIDYYLSVMSQLCVRVEASSAVQPWKVAMGVDLSQILLQTPLPKVLIEAGFTFTHISTPKSGINFERLRKNPTLQDVLEIYIGAVTVLISIMKPSRDIEITNLSRICLLRTSRGQYWLDSDLAKRTKAERRARTGGKPIPVITARAIQQVRKLNRGLTKLFRETDSHMRSKLFYLPNPIKWGSGKIIDSGSLNSYLDKFCDYVGLPPDIHGRRWYLRIQQMRKWFLLLLFWSGRYDVLDAARWIAGHTDIGHLYAYIEREFPGGKIGQLEAECAIERLAEYDKTQVLIDGEDEGLAELYKRVLRQLRVKTLNMVPEREWQALVEDLFEHDYHIEPYSIATTGGQQRLCIAIRQGERKGDD
ncbi:hypothetical protein ACQKPX_18095 [Photobacterium sp. DNB23_23_1]